MQKLADDCETANRTLEKLLAKSAIVEAEYSTIETQLREVASTQDTKKVDLNRPPADLSFREGGCKGYALTGSLQRSRTSQKL